MPLLESGFGAAVGALIESTFSESGKDIISEFGKHIIVETGKEGFRKLSGAALARVAGHLGRPANKAAARAIRRAQLHAVQHVLNTYQRLEKSEWAADPSSKPMIFIDRAHAFLNEQIGASRSLTLKMNESAVEKIEASLNYALSGVHAASLAERAARLRVNAEEAARVELHNGVKIGSDDSLIMPDDFIALFEGRVPNFKGWFECFTAFVGKELNRDEQFRSIFTTTRLGQLVEGQIALRTIVDNLISRYDTFAEKFVTVAARTERIEEKVKILVAALPGHLREIDKQRDPAARASNEEMVEAFVAPRLLSGTMPKAAGREVPSIKIRFESGPEGQEFAFALTSALNAGLSNSGWFVVVPSGPFGGDARHDFRGRLFRDQLSISLELRCPGASELSRDECVFDTFSYQVGASAKSVADKINSWLQLKLFMWEERRAIACEWKSGDPKQLIMWAHILWCKRTRQANARARRLLARARELDKTNLAIPNLLVSTLVEAIHMGWYDSKVAIQRIDKCIEICRGLSGGRLDAMTLVSLAHSEVFKRSYKDALRYLSWAVEENPYYLIGRMYLALHNSFAGNFSEANRILEAPEMNVGDPAFCFAKQVQSQALFLARQYDAGEAAAREALRADLWSAPALRSLAANLVAMDRLNEAQSSIELSKKSSRFVTAIYQNQFWHCGEFEFFPLALWRAGVPEV